MKREEEAFREKAKKYVVCFNEHCTRHNQCLRYLVGQYADCRGVSIPSVNVRHPQVVAGDCPLYRQNIQVVHKVGLTQFYLDMPGRMERAIRHQLISLFTHRIYYLMRNGKRLITPAEQEQIAAVCRQAGWNGELVYDGETTDWLW